MTKSEYEEIVAYLREVIRNTSWEGKVFTVGGCIRDALMGRDIHDVDLAVATPDGGVMFPVWLEKKGLTLGAPTLFRRFSSSRLRLKAFPQHEIEVVQTRKEQYTDENSRNPEVCFGSIYDDCIRRDLTINSLYENVSTGELLDLTGRGVDDIENHRINTPMDPEDTFSDDPIRILRTLRFAVKYGWKIPDEVYSAMKSNAGRMKIVRRPRISTEFEKMLLSDRPVKIFELMKDIGVIFRVFPELSHLYKVKDHSQRDRLGPSAKLPTLWQLTMEKLDEVVRSDSDSLERRFAALFSQFHRVRIPYSNARTNDGKSSRQRKDNSRSSGRNAVIRTVLRRLMYAPDFIARVIDIVALENGENPTELNRRSRNSKTGSKDKKKKRYRYNRRKTRDAHN